MNKSEKGRIIVNTGDGKGKTTASLGTVFRTLGYNRKVCIIQFLKGKGDYGERLMAANIPNLEWYICGKGFVFNKENIEEDKQIAREGFKLAYEKVMSDNYDLIVLDELTYLHFYNFLDVERIIELLCKKPERLSIIITGRNADPKLIEIADTVTEMKAIKHAFNTGIKAQKGIEF